MEVILVVLSSLYIAPREVMLVTMSLSKSTLANFTYVILVNVGHVQKESNCAFKLLLTACLIISL